MIAVMPQPVSEAQKYLKEHNYDSTLYIYGQDFNPRAYAIAASDFVIRLIDLERNNAFALIGKHADGINSVIWLDPKTIASGGVDGLVRGWDAGSKKQTFAYSHW